MNPDPAIGSNPDLETRRQLLTSFYTKYNPSKLVNVPRLATQQVFGDKHATNGFTRRPIEF